MIVPSDAALEPSPGPLGPRDTQLGRREGATRSVPARLRAGLPTRFAARVVVLSHTNPRFEVASSGYRIVDIASLRRTGHHPSLEVPLEPFLVATNAPVVGTYDEPIDSILVLRRPATGRPPFLFSNSCTRRRNACFSGSRSGSSTGCAAPIRSWRLNTRDGWKSRGLERRLRAMAWRSGDATPTDSAHATRTPQGRVLLPERAQETCQRVSRKRRRNE